MKIAGLWKRPLQKLLTAVIHNVRFEVRVATEVDENQVDFEIGAKFFFLYPVVKELLEDRVFAGNYQESLHVATVVEVFKEDVEWVVPDQLELDKFPKETQEIVTLASFGIFQLSDVKILV